MDIFVVSQPQFTMTPMIPKSIANAVWCGYDTYHLCNVAMITCCGSQFKYLVGTFNNAMILDVILRFFFSLFNVLDLNSKHYICKLSDLLLLSLLKKIDLYDLGFFSFNNQDGWCNDIKSLFCSKRYNVTFGSIEMNEMEWNLIFEGMGSWYLRGD